MIQRIQTVYLLVAVICLACISFGMNIFSFEVADGHYTFSSYGVQKFDAQNAMVEFKSSVLYLSTIALMLLCLLDMFSYKNLARQLRLGRVILFVYLILAAGMTVIAFSGSDVVGETVKGRHFEFGFYLFLVGIPFVFMANMGVKRDKKLLDSLNRLR